MLIQIPGSGAAPFVVGSPSAIATNKLCGRFFNAGMSAAISNSVCSKCYYIIKCVRVKLKLML